MNEQNVTDHDVLDHSRSYQEENINVLISVSLNKGDFCDETLRTLARTFRKFYLELAEMLNNKPL